MGGARMAGPGVRGDDVEHDSGLAVLDPPSAGGAGAVPGAVQDDVDDSAPPVGGDPLRGADEVARGVVHQPVETAVTLDDGVDHLLHLVRIPDIHDAYIRA